MSLPYFKSDDQSLTLLQTNWAQILNPIIQNPSTQSIILPNISLVAGDNTINHLLQRKLQGWKIVRQRASATFFDKQDSNPQPQLTLILNASAPVVINLEVF